MNLGNENTTVEKTKHKKDSKKWYFMMKKSSNLKAKYIKTVIY